MVKTPDYNHAHNDQETILSVSKQTTSLELKMTTLVIKKSTRTTNIQTSTQSIIIIMYQGGY